MLSRPVKFLSFGQMNLAQKDVKFFSFGQMNLAQKDVSILQTQKIQDT